MMKVVSAKYPATAHFSDRQLVLFQEFLCNTEEERQQLSNTIELWDSIPRYSISQKAMAKMRDIRGHLDLLKLEFEFMRVKYNIQIQAALLEEAINEQDGAEGSKFKTIAYYPSSNEELIEEVLRKLAVDQTQGFYEKNKSQSGVVFSLYQLREELKRRGHARSFLEIKKSLNILAGSTITIVANGMNGVNSKTHVKSSYLPLLATVSRNDMETDKNAKCLVQFHPLVTESIYKLSYRQFNYHQLMRHTTQLARWLHKQLLVKYTFASKSKPFEMRYSTIKRDSAMLDSYSRSRGAQEACDFSVNELVTQNILSSVVRRVEIGKRGKILDVIYTFIPSIDFVAEVKAANKRRNNYPQTQ